MTIPQDNLISLQKEYILTTQRLQAVWQTFGNTFGIAVSGIIIALIMVAGKYPASGPVFIIFPFVIVAWYVMMELQGKELLLRGRYLALLEEIIQKATNQVFPCVESNIMPLLYNTWRYQLLRIIVGAPLVLMYVFVTVKAIMFIKGGEFDKFSTTLITVYILFPVVSIMLTYLNGRAINKELAIVKNNLAKNLKSIHPDLEAAHGR